jgi:hypothetical protein
MIERRPNCSRKFFARLNGQSFWAILNLWWSFRLFVEARSRCNLNCTGKISSRGLAQAFGTLAYGCVDGCELEPDVFAPFGVFDPSGAMVSPDSLRRSPGGVFEELEPLMLDGCELPVSELLALEPGVFAPFGVTDPSGAMVSPFRSRRSPGGVIPCWVCVFESLCWFWVAVLLCEFEPVDCAIANPPHNSAMEAR